jgi:hypothetical protein
MINNKILNKKKLKLLSKNDIYLREGYDLYSLFILFKEIIKNLIIIN